MDTYLRVNKKCMNAYAAMHACMHSSELVYLLLLKCQKDVIVKLHIRVRTDLVPLTNRGAIAGSGTIIQIYAFTLSFYIWHFS